MGVIAAFKRPTNVEELRLAIYHLLNDAFSTNASIETRGWNFIEYRDLIAGGAYGSLDVDILIVDSSRHPRAQLEFDRWADDAPPDDGSSLQVGGDASTVWSRNEAERVEVENVRTLMDTGVTAGEIIRRMHGKA